MSTRPIQPVHRWVEYLILRPSDQHWHSDKKPSENKMSADPDVIVQK